MRFPNGLDPWLFPPPHTHMHTHSNNTETHKTFMDSISKTQKSTENESYSHGLNLEIGS